MDLYIKEYINMDNYCVEKIAEYFIYNILGKHKYSFNKCVLAIYSVLVSHCSGLKDRSVN